MQCLLAGGCHEKALDNQVVGLQKCTRAGHFLVGLAATNNPYSHKHGGLPTALTRVKTETYASLHQLPLSIEIVVYICQTAPQIHTHIAEM